MLRMNAPDQMAARRRQTAHTLQERLVKHVAAGRTTDLAPHQRQLPSNTYTCPERARQEQALFRDLPVLAGFSSELSEPGSALTFDDLGVPLLLVRGTDGKVRGFRNMCLHRGTRLVNGGKPSCNLGDSFACPFHAWRYDLEGQLLAIPGERGFPDVTLGSSLPKVQVEEWQGLLFVSVSDQPTPLNEYLESFAGELEQLELHRLVPVQHSSLDAATNWKLALDTYGESYHFSTLHTDTIGVSHFSDVATFDAFGPHYRMAFAERTLQSLTSADPETWPEPAFNGVWFVFPNTLFVVGALADGAMCVRCFRLFPGNTPGEMCCHITVLAPPEVVADEARVAREFAYDDARSEITLEDYGVAESAYANFVNAPDAHELVFGRNEIAIQHFHDTLDALLRTSGTSE